MLRAYLLCETRTYRVQHVFVMRKNQKFATAFKQVQNIVPETSSREAGFIYSIFQGNFCAYGTGSPIHLRDYWHNVYPSQISPKLNWRKSEASVYSIYTFRHNHIFTGHALTWPLGFCWRKFRKSNGEGLHVVLYAEKELNNLCQEDWRSKHEHKYAWGVRLLLSCKKKNGATG